MNKKMSLTRWMLCSLVFLAGSLSLSAVELYVNQKDAKADDKNSGTREEPLKTISAAAKIVKPGDTVTVAPGIYREAVTLTVSGEKDKPIVFRSEEPLKAVISGSDVLANLKPESPGVWSASVPKNSDLADGWLRQ